MKHDQTLSTLRKKRDDIAGAVDNYEQRLAQAHADLVHIEAAISLFEASGDRKGLTSYVNLHRLFRYGEMFAVAQEALAKEGQLTTCELALRLMAAKGLDTGDNVLAKSVGGRLIHILRQKWKRGLLVSDKKRGNVRVWQIP
jgi:hypothetical protein